MTAAPPAFGCARCGRQIGKRSTHYLTDEGQRVLCVRCTGRDAHAGLFPGCPARWHDVLDHPFSVGTRAGIAAHLGLWPATSPAAPAFRSWLKRFASDQRPIGDLARDARAGQSWPRGPGSLARYEAHLRGMGASPAAIAALGQAWERYQREAGR